MAYDDDLESKLKSLELEREMMGIDEVTQANSLFREGLVPAVQQLCHIATYGVNEKLRFDASRYVVERNLGVLRDGTVVPEEDPFTKLLAACVREYEDPTVDHEGVDN